MEPSLREGVRGFRRQGGSDARTLVLLIAGYAGLVAYCRMLSLGFAGYLDRGVYVSVDPWYTARTASAVAVFVLLALAGRFRWFSIGIKTLAVATAAMVGSAIVFAVDGAGTYGLAVDVAGGASSAVLMFAWMLLLGRYPVRRIIAATLSGAAIGSAVVLAAPYAGEALGLMLAVACAFVAGMAAITLDPQVESCAADGPLGESERMRVPWLSYVMILTCSFLMAMFYGVAQHLTWLYDWSPSWMACVLAALLVIGCTAAIMVWSRAWMHMVWVPLFALFAVALVCACLPVRETIQAAVSLALAAMLCSSFMPWMVFPAMFSTVKAPRVFLAGVALVFANSSLATLAGSALGTVLPRSVQTLGGVSGLMAVLLALVLAVAFVTSRHAVVQAGAPADAEGPAAGVDPEGPDGPIAGQGEKAPAPMERAAAAASGAAQSPPSTPEERREADDASLGGGPAPDAAPIDVLRQRVDDIVGAYGLTPRESEVALLTVQGLTCAYIAEKLVVSESTVRFHQRNLYRKLDVHSRNEFIERVNAG